MRQRATRAVQQATGRCCSSSNLSSCWPSPRRSRRSKRSRVRLIAARPGCSHRSVPPPVILPRSCRRGALARQHGVERLRLELEEDATRRAGGKTVSAGSQFATAKAKASARAGGSTLAAGSSLVAAKTGSLGRSAGWPSAAAFLALRPRARHLPASRADPPRGELRSYPARRPRSLLRASGSLRADIGGAKLALAAFAPVLYVGVAKYRAAGGTLCQSRCGACRRHVRGRAIAPIWKNRSAGCRHRALRSSCGGRRNRRPAGERAVDRNLLSPKPRIAWPMSPESRRFMGHSTKDSGLRAFRRTCRGSGSLRSPSRRRPPPSRVRLRTLHLGAGRETRYPYGCGTHGLRHRRPEHGPRRLGPKVYRREAHWRRPHGGERGTPNSVR